MVRLETVIVMFKVGIMIFLIGYLGYNWGGHWMCAESKWSLYAAYLTIAIGLNMSLLLRRVREGMAERFRSYALGKLSQCSIRNGGEVLTEESLNYLGMCYQILSDRFAKVTDVPGKVLSFCGLVASIMTVGLFVTGVPNFLEHFIALAALPGILYYVFLAHVYCDVIVQMDGACIDVLEREVARVNSGALFSEIRCVSKKMGL